MSFQRIVLTIAIVMLIITLAIIAYMLHTQKETIVFPPEAPACPDYFEAVADGNGAATQRCLNTQGLGNGAPGQTDFATVNGGAASCPGNKPCSKAALVARCKWAKAHGITWDGVSNRTEAVSNPNGSGLVVRPIC